MNNNNISTLRDLIHSAFSNWGFSWRGLINNQKGELWLIGQLIIICAHLLPAWELTYKLKGHAFAGNILIVISIILCINSFISLGASFTPLPMPKKGCKLITKKAYNYCRHPLYQSLIILSLGVTITLNSILHIILLFSLIIVLRKKARVEEDQLCQIHPEYKKYMESTISILPGIPYLDWRQ